MSAGLIPLDLHHLSDSIIQMAGILFCDSKDCETQASKQASKWPQQYFVIHVIVKAKQTAGTMFCDS
jgi:hypothetical protein